MNPKQSPRCRVTNNANGKITQRERGRQEISTMQQGNTGKRRLLTQGDERGGENQNMGTPDTRNLKMQDYYK